MSFTSVDNRVRFSSSHPTRKPFRLAKGAESDSSSGKGTKPAAGSSGDLKNLPNYIKSEKKKQKAAEMDWFNSSVREAERASRGR